LFSGDFVKEHGKVVRWYGARIHTEKGEGHQGLGMSEISGITLKGLLKHHDFVDAIDADLQTGEIEVFSEANRETLKKVGSIRMETHTHNIHNSLRKMFGMWGWIIEHDYLDDTWTGVKLVENPLSKSSCFYSVDRVKGRRTEF
jgi:hypothetical protein